MAKANEADIKAIFDYWNSFKGQANFRSHRAIMPDITKAVKARLKDGFTVEQINAAIKNYAEILISPEYVWSRAWPLAKFLTRARPDNRQELQIYRFIENNFNEADFEQTTVGKQRVEVRKEYSEKIRAAPAEKLIAAHRDNVHKNMWFLIDELRPEIQALLAADKQKGDL